MWERACTRIAKIFVCKQTPTKSSPPRPLLPHIFSSPLLRTAPVLCGSLLASEAFVSTLGLAFDSPHSSKLISQRRLCLSLSLVTPIAVEPPLPQNTKPRLRLIVGACLHANRPNLRLQADSHKMPPLRRTLPLWPLIFLATCNLPLVFCLSSKLAARSSPLLLKDTKRSPPAPNAHTTPPAPP